MREHRRQAPSRITALQQPCLEVACCGRTTGSSSQYSWGEERGEVEEWAFNGQRANPTCVRSVCSAADGLRGESRTLKRCCPRQGRSAGPFFADNSVRRRIKHGTMAPGRNGHDSCSPRAQPGVSGRDNTRRQPSARRDNRGQRTASRRKCPTSRKHHVRVRRRSRQAAYDIRDILTTSTRRHAPEQLRRKETASRSEDAFQIHPCTPRDLGTLVQCDRIQGKVYVHYIDRVEVASVPESHALARTSSFGKSANRRARDWKFSSTALECVEPMAFTCSHGWCIGFRKENQWRPT